MNHVKMLAHLALHYRLIGQLLLGLPWRSALAGALTLAPGCPGLPHLALEFPGKPLMVM
jgi:hypothetical protein